MIGLLGMQAIQYGVVSFFHNRQQQKEDTCGHGHSRSHSHPHQTFQDKDQKIAKVTVPPPTLTKIQDRDGSTSSSNTTNFIEPAYFPQVDADGCVLNGIHEPQNHFHSHHPCTIKNLNQRRTAVYLLEIGVAVHSGMCF